MGTGSILLVGGTEADDALDDNERGSVLFLGESFVSRVKAPQIIGVGNRYHLPAKSFESRRDVFAKRQFGATLDRDLIVVVDPAEI